MNRKRQHCHWHYFYVVVVVVWFGLILAYCILVVLARVSKKYAHRQANQSKFKIHEFEFFPTCRILVDFGFLVVHMLKNQQQG